MVKLIKDIDSKIIYDLKWEYWFDKIFMLNQKYLNINYNDLDKIQDEEFQEHIDIIKKYRKRLNIKKDINKLVDKEIEEFNALPKKEQEKWIKIHRKRAKDFIKKLNKWQKELDGSKIKS